MFDKQINDNLYALKTTDCEFVWFLSDWEKLNIISELVDVCLTLQENTK